jgi:hypothetical protein
MMSVAAGANNDDFFLLFLDSGNDKVSARKGNVSTSGTAVSTLDPGAGVWSHAAGTFNSSTSRFAFLNGVKSTENTTSISFGAALTRTGLFHNARSSQDFVYEGELAFAGIWDVVLTDGEIMALAKGLSPLHVRPQSLKGYWPIYGNDSPEPDRGKNRYDMTISGTLNKATNPRIYKP